MSLHNICEMSDESVVPRDAESVQDESVVVGSGGSGSDLGLTCECAPRPHTLSVSTVLLHHSVETPKGNTTC